MQVPCDATLGPESEGTLNVKTLPHGACDPTVTRPPWARATSLTIESPSPLPPRVRAGSARKNRSKTAITQVRRDAGPLVDDGDLRHAVGASAAHDAPRPRRA